LRRCLELDEAKGKDEVVGTRGVTRGDRSAPAFGS
jgi:hypothetical protein